ncbi:Casein kinase II subunit beta [Spironucleus salmonicida]|uniref:Casein kinase II subunit beta n=1 Tax=Spironucleus salmonicida TaxID=348837 RepID=V6LU81_9EUKA|nr:Casein kinase II subunit beta [Spironucleus salmonicida]|eukprot:EST47256.1 Casein kinase II beta chain [Spironucleus salmonicida]
MAYNQHSSQEISSSGTSDLQIQNIQSEYLIEVPYEYVADPFNHTDLQKLFTDFPEVLSSLKNAVLHKNQQLISTMEPLILYGLIHKRYIQTEEGLKQFYKLVQSNVYGKCPTDGCNCQVVPVGLDNTPGISPFAVYCVKCNDTYHFHGQNPVDGAFFGVDIAQLLFIRFVELEKQFASQEGIKDMYCGNYLFGFQLDYVKLQLAKEQKELLHKQKKEMRLKTQEQ